MITLCDLSKYSTNQYVKWKTTGPKVWYESSTLVGIVTIKIEVAMI